MIGSKEPMSRTGHERVRAIWPWLVLGVWLAVSAGQIWSMQLESVQAGEVCSAVTGSSIFLGVR